MALTSSQIKDFVLFYAISSQWQHIEKLLGKISSLRRSNTEIEEFSTFWEGLCAFHKRDTETALSCFTSLENSKSFGLASLAAAIETHQKAEDPNNQLISSLKSSMRKQAKTTNINTLLNCAIFFWFCKHIKQAKQYGEKAYQLDESKIETLWTVGWIYFLTDNKKYVKKGAMYFANAVSIVNKQNIAIKNKNAENKDKNETDSMYAASNPQQETPLPLLALYGLSKCYQKKQKSEKAVQCINQIIVFHPWFCDAFVIKAKLQLLHAIKEFGGQNYTASNHNHTSHHSSKSSNSNNANNIDIEAISTLQRYFTKIETIETENGGNNIYCCNIESYLIELYYHLVFKSNDKIIFDKLNKLYSLVTETYKMKQYQCYSQWFYQIADITSKYVIDSTQILNLCQKFLSVAVHLESDNSLYLTTQARLYAYQSLVLL